MQMATIKKQYKLSRTHKGGSLGGKFSARHAPAKMGESETFTRNEGIDICEG